MGTCNDCALGWLGTGQGGRSGVVGQERLPTGSYGAGCREQRKRLKGAARGEAAGWE